jgi:periplasmic protein TorT
MKILRYVINPQTPYWLKNSARMLCAFTFLILIATAAAQTPKKAWYPVEVDVWNPPFNDQRQRKQKVYTPLDKAQKKWRIRVFIPHLKDAYWLGVNYGLIDEARRLGISLSIYEAGGYDQLAVQRRQIEETLKEKPDGLIIGAISLDGLNDLVKKAADQGIPVLDLINGISSPHIMARTAVTYWDNGYQTGQYLLGLQKIAGKPLVIAWFPGPKGPGWVAAGDQGFREAVAGDLIKILHTEYGDTGSAVQGKLIESVLARDTAGLDFIVGTTVTAEAAVKALRRRDLKDNVKVLSYYYSPGVHRGIRRGDIVAAPTDCQVLQARIAVDVIVRILEKRDYYKHVAPRVQVVDGSNIRTWDSSTTLAPRGFRPIFSIND